MSRGMVEQEMYEQFIDMGMDEYTADLLASENAIEDYPWADPANERTSDD